MTIDIVSKDQSMMDLFELFDWYSLDFLFSSLNSRFDTVLASCHTIHVNLDCIPPNMIMSPLVRYVPSPVPRRIGSFQSSINRNIKLVLHDDFILSSFVRSLWSKSTKKQLNFCLKNPSIVFIRILFIYLYHLTTRVPFGTSFSPSIPNYVSVSYPMYYFLRTWSIYS